MLYPMKELLLDAQKNKYGIGAFNVISMDQANSTITCAEDLNSPVIIQIAEVHLPFVQFDELVDYLYFRITHASVPIALHLDHGAHIENILTCINRRFSSVMADGSELDYEDNVQLSKRVVEICSLAGISVEAELGYVGNEGMGGEGGVANQESFTNPDQVEDFVSRTNIDALAIAFGNVHGKYKGEPNLNFALLEEIRRRVKIPLVLHGGSGISEQDFKKIISLGICKINFFASVESKILEAVEQEPQYPHALGNKLVKSDKNIREVVGEHIKIFGSHNRCQKAKFITH